MKQKCGIVKGKFDAACLLDTSFYVVLPGAWLPEVRTVDVRAPSHACQDVEPGTVDGWYGSQLLAWILGGGRNSAEARHAPLRRACACVDHLGRSHVQTLGS